MKYTKVEVHSGPDEDGKYLHTRFHMASYHPGHPFGENRIAERAQVFNSTLPGDKEVSRWEGISR